MAKTQLTKNIEIALSTYKPCKFGDFELNYKREQYKDFEVSVTHSHTGNGLVDCVWLAEGYTNPKNINKCSAPWYIENKSAPQLKHEIPCSFTPKEIVSFGKKEMTKCECLKKCHYQTPIISKEEVYAIVCFEIKITKSDFHSSHGHNFIGNLNYYVMPYTLYKEVINEIPDDIGIITYHSKNEKTVGYLKQQKPSRYTPDVNLKLYNSLLLTFMNKKSKKEQKMKNTLILLGTELNSDINSILSDFSKLLMQKECKKNGFPKCYTNYGSNTSKVTHCSKPYRNECNRYECVFNYLYLKNKYKFDGIDKPIFDFIDKFL